MMSRSTHSREGLPLAGIRVLEVTTTVFGPYTCQLLGDLGADVIKIEPPAGDATRDIGPMRSPKMGALFLGSNRNKRSVVLDLKTERGASALWSLIEGADVFVHNMRAKKIKALGFGPDPVRARNNQIVYAGLHGYLEEGPYGDRPAYDDVIQGQAGIAGTFQVRDGEPAVVPSIMADKTAALMAVNGILAAVIKRARTGTGSYVEMGMFEALSGFNLVEHQYGGTFIPEDELGRGYPRMLARDRRPFQTRDGYLCMMAYTDAQWRRFWDLVGKPDVGGDVRFEKMAARAKNIIELYRLATQEFPARTTAEWLTALAEAEIPAGPVNSLDDLRRDAHLVAIDFYREIEHPSEGRLEVPDTPYRLDGDRLRLQRGAPRLGEHTAEVLRAAGVGEAEIEALTP